jgi:hypothetical protein
MGQKMIGEDDVGYPTHPAASIFIFLLTIQQI